MALSMMVYYPKGLRPEAVIADELNHCFSALRDFDGVTYEAQTDQIGIETLTDFPWECTLIRIRSEQLVSDKVFVLFRHGRIVGAIPEYFVMEARAIRQLLGAELKDVYGSESGVVFEYAGGCEKLGEAMAVARKQLIHAVK